uniref:inorganic diphosphatase n=1 Tax=Solanum tuberosum TaxID=4113 RepID=M0ZTX5_SOLTU
MAAARVMVSTSNTLTASLLSKGPLRRPNNFSLCFRNGPVQKRRLFTCSAIYNPQIQTIEEGQPETLDYRVFFADNSGKKISPWHDIPLHLGDGVFNFVVEIPKESSAKMEVATDEQHTPIKQDTKKGKLRYYPALSQQSGTGLETIRYLMENLPIGLLLATSQQTRITLLRLLRKPMNLGQSWSRDQSLLVSFHLYKC